ncbi:MAG: HutD family protein [Fusobacteriaceae bacterium]
MNNIKNIFGKKWSGGITREIYKDQNDFNIRISCAEIYPGESVFSDFTGYKRILKILENEVILQKNSDKKIFLDKNNVFNFDGSDKVKSKNEDLVLDFNVIYNSNFYEVSFEEVNGYYSSVKNKNKGEKVFIFSTEEASILFINNCNLNFQKYDFLLLDFSSSYKLNGNFIVVKFSNNKTLLVR